MKRAALLCLLLALPLSHAHAERPASSYGGLTLRATGISHAAANIDSDTEVKRNTGLFSLSYMQPLSRFFIPTLSVNYDLLDYHWTAPSIFKGSVPSFSKVTRYGAGLNLLFRNESGWMAFISPSIQYAYVEGAERSEAFSWGVVATAIRSYKSGNSIGLGLGYFNDINKVRTLPFLAINWQINEQWSIGNPFSTGFSGPAGLELRYQLEPNLQLGLGGSKRNERFLANTANKETLEVDEWLSFLRAGYDFSEDCALNAYLGYIFASDIEFSSSERKEHIDDHLATALHLKYKF